MYGGSGENGVVKRLAWRRQHIKANNQRKASSMRQKKKRISGVSAKK